MHKEILISKTTFQDFLYCPRNVWLKLHKPELLEHFELSEFEKHLLEQGNEVESCARNLFPNGIEVKSRGEDAVNETIKFMALRVPTIFQATFIVDGFIARNDMLSLNNVTGLWDLYEVKGSNTLKENVKKRDHIEDVAFQASVLKKANVPLGRIHVVHLNKTYIRNGDLDCKELFKIEDVTDKVTDKISEIEGKMKIARGYLTQDDAAVLNCECIYRGRSNHCATFQHTHSHVPTYSVHDISRLYGAKLEKLIDVGIFDINEIPEDFELTDIQQNQVVAHRTQTVVINREMIKQELDQLKYPLYFFDYEAVGLAIPAFNGYGPYKSIPFQFSLHILRTPAGELEHIEYLHPDLTDPSESVARHLKQYILPGGTVVAWNKSYEARINKEIGSRLPEYAQFFEEVNASLYDLKDIFSKQHYIHDSFHGSASLKKVLPTLAPELSYDQLGIQEGGAAVDAWWKMVSPSTTPTEKAKLESDLKTYCGLDTFAMYAIWKHLYGQVSAVVAKV
jgi:hypothetical protein